MSDATKIRPGGFDAPAVKPTIPEAIERFKAAERVGLVEDATALARHLTALGAHLAKAAASGELHDIAWQLGTAGNQLANCAALKRSADDLARYENLADAIRGGKAS